MQNQQYAAVYSDWDPSSEEIDCDDGQGVALRAAEQADQVVAFLDTAAPELGPLVVIIDVSEPHTAFGVHTSRQLCLRAYRFAK
jgi:hypothetical protein